MSTFFQKTILRLVLVASFLFKVEASVYTPITEGAVPFSGGSQQTFIQGASGNSIYGHYSVGTIGGHNTYAGFVDNGTTKQVINYPSVYATIITGINGTNIIGTALDYNTGTAHGFIYNGSRFTTLDNPLALNSGNAGTYLMGGSGSTYVGFYITNSNLLDRQGFTYNGSTYTTLNNPLNSNWTQLMGISGSNIVGIFKDGNNKSQSFLYNGTSFTTLSGPNGAVSVSVTGISGNNIYGSWKNASEITSGFIYDGNSYSSYSNGTNYTVVTGLISDSVYGYYNLGANTYGFSTPAVPEPSTHAFLGIASLVLLVALWRRKSRMNTPACYSKAL